MSKEKTDIVFVALDINEIFIGCCGIHNINAESVELGLWLKENSQSQGLGTEIISSRINFIEQNFMINCVVYPVDREGVISIRIPEKLGFKEFKTCSKQKNDSVNLNIVEYRKYYCG